nr:hypothetical protein [Tanacetum cinerariifolium]
MERGFLSLKGSGRRGVKEKSGGPIDVSAKVNNRVDEGTTASSNVVPNTHDSANDTTQVTGVTPSAVDGLVKSRSGDHMVDENVGQTPSNITDNLNTVDVVVLMESIRAISEQFATTAYGFFLGKRVAYPVIANYFRSIEDLDAMLKNGPWFIRSNPLILEKWNPDMNLLKEDVGNVLVWVKLHGVPVTAFGEDGLSVIATKIDTFDNEFPKNKVSNVIKNMKKLSKLIEYSGNKKKDAEPTKEVSKSNSFNVLNSVENDVDLESSSTSTTPIVEKINRMERLNIDVTATLVDDEASKDVGYGTNSLLEQWKDSYRNWEYDYDPYDDDMYEGQDIHDKIQYDRSVTEIRKLHFV